MPVLTPGITMASVIRTNWFSVGMLLKLGLPTT